MNSKLRTLIAGTVAAAFPFAVVAQSGSSTDRSSSVNDPSTTRGSSAMTAGQTGAGALSGSGMSGLQRVSKDSIDRQLTAKALIGKDVYDNQNEKIGEVEDVVLDSSRAPRLATAFTSRDGGNDRAMGSTSATAGTQRSVAPGATGGTHARASGERSTTGDTTRSDSALGTASSTLSQISSAVHGAMGESAAIISAGGLFSRNDLVSVPLSQLSYDASNDRITLNLSREQFSRLTESEAGRSAAE